MAHIGKVALVGAGPGDEGLLTLRGYELLKKADCVVYDRLLNKNFLDIPGDKCERIYVGKENHHHTLGQDSINELLLKKAREYDLVVRLKGGDPYVFGRGGEEALFLYANNVEVEVVPGISSSVAAAELAGIPVTHRGLSKGFSVITAHSRKDKISDIDFSKLTDPDITLVFLMGLSHVKDISKALINVGRDKDTGAAVISCGTTAHQQKCVGTLETIGELVEKAELPSPSIIVVGKVVQLSEQLSFFEKRPLFGRKFFLPEIKRFEYSYGNGIQRSENQLAKSLREMGAEVITEVSGKIEPVEFDLDFLKEASDEDHIVFTSSSGVNAFFYNLFEIGKRDIRFLPKCRFAAVGSKTAAALLKFGIVADQVPDKFTASDFARSLAKTAKSGTTIYWLCGKTHSSDMEQEIPKEVNLKEIVCYENVACKAEISAEEQEFIQNSCTILTSKSNAEFALKTCGKLPEEVISIGPSCTRYLENQGVKNIEEASEASYEGILKLIGER